MPSKKSPFEELPDLAFVCMPAAIIGSAAGLLASLYLAPSNPAHGTSALLLSTGASIACSGILAAEIAYYDCQPTKEKSSLPIMTALTATAVSLFAVSQS